MDLTISGKNAPVKVILPGGKRKKKFCVFEDGRLVASSFFEMGASASYGYYAIFDRDIEWRRLGIFTMLKEIEYAREQENEFYYLGYAFDKPTPYEYKKRRFVPLWTRKGKYPCRLNVPCSV